MKILVTGAGGYLGSKIVDNLLYKGFAVIPVTRDRCNLLYANQVRELIRETSPDRIIHCAAFVPKIPSEYNDDRNKLNIDMTENILISSQCPMVYISSMTASNPVTEYAMSKLRGELRLQMLNNGLSIRIPGLFGPPRKNGLIYNMLNTIKFQYTHSLTLSDDLTEWTGMHVDDAAEEIAKLATGGIDGYRLIELNHSILTRQFIESLIKLSIEI